MITIMNTRSVESTIKPLDEAKYTFDPDNMRHIAAILREMYSDPVLAVVREYCANAVDAHVFAGKANTPIDIVVPTRENPVFEVRDFGNGLSDDEVKKLLFGYASSGDEKRTSNELIGGFGIGAKSGYAVTDQFKFISRHKGIQSTWLCYRDQDDDCRAKKVGECPTVFDDGLEVSIPVPMDLIDDFHKAIASAFVFYKVKPNLISATPELRIAVNRDIPKSTFSGSVTIIDKDGNKANGTWDFIENAEHFFKPFETSKYRYSYERSSYPKNFVVMGQIAYPLDFSKIDMSDKPFTGYILRVPIGSLQLAPSREALSYTARVKETLKGVIQVTLDTVEKQIQGKLSSASSSHDLFSLLKTVEDSLPPDLKRVLDGKDVKSELAKRGLTWTGYDIKAADFEQVIHGTSKQRWISHKYRTFYSVSTPFENGNTTGLIAGKFAPIVCVVAEPGDKLPRFAKELFIRAGSHQYPNMLGTDGTNPLNDRPSFYVLVCRSDKVPSLPWLSDGSVPVVKYADLPEMADDAWLNSVVTTTKSSRSYSGNRVSYSQHSKKFAKLIREPVNYGTTKSENWEAVSAKDLKDIEGNIVYTFHDRFFPVRKEGGNLQGVYGTANRLLEVDPELFPELKRGVYGIRKGDKDWTFKQENLINISDYLDQSVEKIIKKYGVTMDELRAGAYVLRMAKDHHELSGMVPWFLGASLDKTTDLYRYLNIFRTHLKLVKYVSIFLDLDVGRELANKHSFNFILKREYGKIKFIDGVTDTTGLNQVFFDFANRCYKTTLRRHYTDSVKHEINYPAETLDGLNNLGKNQVKKHYQLLLEMEKLDL